MATQLFLRDKAYNAATADCIYTHGAVYASLARGNVTWAAQYLATSRGSTLMGMTTTCATGPTAGIEVYASSYGVRTFISPPLSANFTISGSITFNIWMSEGNMSANVSANFRLMRVQPDGTWTQFHKTARTTEVAVTTRAVNNWSETPSSTSFVRGDRIAVIPFGDDSTANMGGSGYDFSTSWNGPTAGADGDAYVTFNENLTFESAPAGTTVYPTTSSALSDYEAWTSRGGGAASAVTATVAGPTAPIQVTSSDGSPTVVGTATLTATHTPQGICIDSTNTYVYICTTASTVEQIRISDMTVTATCSLGSLHYPYAICIDSTDTYLYVANRTANTMEQIRISDMTVTGTVAVTAVEYGICISADDAYVYVACTDAVVQVTLSSMTVTGTATLSASRGTRGVIASPNGAYVYVACLTSNTVEKITTSTMTYTSAASLGSTHNPSKLCISSDGAYLYVSCGAADTVEQITTSSMTVTGTATTGDLPSGICITSDDAYLFVCVYNANLISKISVSSMTVIGSGSVGASHAPDTICIDSTDSYVYVGNNTACNVERLSVAAGVALTWYTKTLQSGTLAGGVLVNARVAWSNASAWCTSRCEIAICDGDGTNAVVWGYGGGGTSTTSTDKIGLTTSEAAAQYWVVGPSTSIAEGKRIRIRFLVDDAYGAHANWAPMQTGYTETLWYNGSSGATGDTYLTFPITLTEYTAPSSGGMPYIGGGYYPA